MFSTVAPQTTQFKEEFSCFTVSLLHAIAMFRHDVQLSTLIGTFRKTDRQLSLYTHKGGGGERKGDITFPTEELPQEKTSRSLCCGTLQITSCVENCICGRGLKTRLQRSRPKPTLTSEGEALGKCVFCYPAYLIRTSCSSLKIHIQ
jgi:hypothetical protein